jgi:alpha-beta hydrolase superfamily lysophospholipase
VRAVAGDRVTLSRSKDTLLPGVFGADWHGGHAILGPILAADGHAVTRRLSGLRGALAPGARIAMDARVYAGDPKRALGLPFANVAIPDELGPMPAWLVPAEGRTWAIFVHGINGSREDGLRILPALHRRGLPTLLIDYREDPGAPASPDGKHHMGLTEWRDLQAAARYALSHGARRLVLVGQSMGGEVVAQFMERSGLAPRVSGLILDAPALDWKAILSFNAKEMGLPSFAVLPVEWLIGERIKADWNSLDAVRHAADFHLPILLFHGTGDKLVPISISDRFARKLGRRVTYYRVPGAAHVQSWNVAPRLYERRVEDFLATIGATG